MMSSTSSESRSFSQNVDEKGFLDTTLHTRIWFSSNPDVFMNTENELRIVRFGAHNPDAQLHIVYSSKMLGEKGIEELNQFRQRHPTVRVIDFDTELEGLCQTEKDRKIYAFAKEELSHSRDRTGGNLGAASDLVRQLTPVAEMGTYSDFDTEIKTKGLPRYVEISEGMIGNFGSFDDSAEGEGLAVNNDMIGFARDKTTGELTQKAKDFLGVIQDCLIRAYENPIEQCQSEQSTLGMILESGSVFTANPDITVIQIRALLDVMHKPYIFFKMSMPLNAPGVLDQFCAKWPPELLGKLEEDFKDINRTDFSEAFTEQDIRLIKEAHIEASNFWVEMVIIPQYQQLKALLFGGNGISEEQKPGVEMTARLLKTQIDQISEIKRAFDGGDIDRAYNMLCTQRNTPGLEDINRDFMLRKDSVTVFSGPYVLKKALSQNYEQISSDLPRLLGGLPYISAIAHAKACAFSESRELRGAYISLNSTPFEGSSADFTQKEKKANGPLGQVGSVCDVSWTEQGRARQSAREKEYLKKAKMIKRNWRITRGWRDTEKVAPVCSKGLYVSSAAAISGIGQNPVVFDTQPTMGSPRQ